MSKNKDIVIVSQAPLTPQIERNSYFRHFQNYGYHTTFWDLSQLLHPGMTFADEYQDVDMVRFYDIHEIENEIKKTHNNSVYLFDFSQNKYNEELFCIFKAYKCVCIRMDMYGNTTIHDSTKEKIAVIFKSGGLSILKIKLNNLYKRIFLPTKSKLIFNFKRVLTSSKYSTRTDAINHPDYEEYLLNKEKIDIDYPYILFIDTYFGFHPDDKYIYNINGKTDVETHYTSLNSYFNYLEETYHKPVIIAAHPKFQECNNMFGCRRIIKYKTLPLIKSADLIVMQVCNTFSWITLLDKSLALISTDIYLSHDNKRNSLAKLTNIFNIKSYNIDHIPYDEVKFRKIKENLRKRYIYGYLTSPETEGKLNIEIIDKIISDIQ